MTALRLLARLPLLLLPAASPLLQSADTMPSATQAPAAAPVADPHDLGKGLRYASLADLGSPTEAAAAKSASALILDLRASVPEAAAEAAMKELFEPRTSFRPVVVLISSDTPAALLGTIPNVPDVLTLAAANSVPATMTIAVDPAQARAALAALAAGRPPRELIEEKVEKTRFDEARLVRNHSNGHPREPDTPASEKPPTATRQPAPLQDVLLQRAVFIHRALLALGRIPAQT
jgi:hypothetical protein